MDPYYESGVRLLDDTLQHFLLEMPEAWRGLVTEIRLRLDRPLTAIAGKDTVFFRRSGGICLQNASGTVTVSREQLERSFQKLCGYSVHSVQRELCQGFLTVGGNRVGLCGTAVTEGGKIVSVRDLTSLNVRIARAVPGASDPILEAVRESVWTGILIVGAPATGKTTMIRDLVRRLANGSTGRFTRVSIVDERGEITGAGGQNIATDLGVSCDLLNGYPKAEGMEIAVRALAPEVLVCDEIGNEEDLSAMLYASHSGVRMIASVHADGPDDLLEKPAGQALIRSGIFSDYFFLERGMVGTVARHLTQSVFREVQRSGDPVHRNYYDRSVLFRRGDSDLGAVWETGPDAGGTSFSDRKDENHAFLRTNADR